MRATIITLILITIITMANGQDKKQIFTKDQLAITVLNLRRDTVIGGKNQTLTGTGTFVSHKDKLYFLTASHVAKDMDEKSYVIIKGDNDKALSFPITDFLNGNNPKWINHPKADMAILELTPKQFLFEKKYLNGRFLPSFYFNEKLVAVSRDIQLTVLGFPLGLGAQAYFSPLTYRTYPSSGLITLNRFDTGIPCEFLILENPSIGGYSGGPVIDLSVITVGAMTTYGDGTTCHGIVHGTISDETGGKLAAITPSSFLFDLLK